MVDLNNLQSPLLEGIRIPTEDGRVKVVTPVFRISFPHLKKPYAGKQGNWEPKYQVVMLFNAANPGIPARIDMAKVMFPAIQEVANAGGLGYQLKNLQQPNYGGDEVPFKRGENFLDKEGNAVKGYNRGTRYFNAKNQEPIPTFDSQRRPLSVDWFKAGYYARGVVSIYASNGKVCYAVEELQLIARGELLGSGPREYSDYMGATQGENFEGSAPNDPDETSTGGAPGNTPTDSDMWHDARGGPQGGQAPQGGGQGGGYQASQGGQGGGYQAPQGGQGGGYQAPQGGGQGGGYNDDDIPF